MERTVSVDGTTVSITGNTTIEELKSAVGCGDTTIALCRDGDNFIALANRDRILECVSSEEDIRISLQKPPEGDRWRAFTHDESDD